MTRNKRKKFNSQRKGYLALDKDAHYNDLLKQVKKEYAREGKVEEDGYYNAESYINCRRKTIDLMYGESYEEYAGEYGRVLNRIKSGEATANDLRYMANLEERMARGTYYSGGPPRTKRENRRHRPY